MSYKLHLPTAEWESMVERHDDDVEKAGGYVATNYKITWRDLNRMAFNQDKDKGWERERTQ
jgi:hypothetical protein